MSYAASPQPSLGGNVATNAQAASLAVSSPNTTTSSPTNGGVNSSGVYVPANGYNGFQTAAPSVPTTMDASSLSSGTGQLQVPNAAASSNPNGLVAQATNGATSALNTEDTGQGGSATDNLRNRVLGTYLGLGEEASQQGAAYQQVAEQAQLPEQEQQLADLRGTIAQRTAAYAQQWQMANTEHAALPYITGEQTQIQRTQAIELGVLGAQEQALAGNLQASQSIVDATINHQFEGIKNAADMLGQYIQLNQNDLSDSEKAQLNQNYTLQQMSVQNLLDTGKSIQNTLASQGLLTPAIASAFAQAKSTADMWTIYNNIVNGNNPSAGTSFNPSSSQATNGVYDGIDWSSYAVNNDGTMNTNAQNSFIATSTAIGPINSTQQATNAIDKLAPKSPITGDMVIQAALKYGVDPNALIARMFTETQLGTDGSAGSKGNNYGNVGNTNSAMAAGNPTNLSSPQAGVDAVAYWMSTHKVNLATASTNGSSSSSSISPTSTTQSGISFDQLVASAPLPIRAPGILNQVSSTGSAYIDLSKVPNNYSGTALSSWARANNVALLSSEEVAQVKTLDEAIGNINNVMAPAWDKIAYNNPLTRIGGAISGVFGQMTDSDTYSNNKTFQQNRESLAQQVKALSGSSPRLGFLSTAIDALPDNSGYFAGTVPIWQASMGDTYKDGVNKMNRTLQYLNQGLSTLIPGDKGTSLLPTSRGGSAPQAQASTYNVGNQSYVLNPSDGLYYLKQ